MSKCPCGFCHLHVHSEYSLLDGANRVKDMAKRAAELDMPALAITDHGVMYGAIDHYSACQAVGIKPIIGCCVPGQLIYTATGVKAIEEIEVGEMVLTHEGRFRPVTRTMTRRYVGPLFGVRAANSNVVWLTDEHPILISDRAQTKLDWVRADELATRVGRAAPGRRGAKNWKSSAVFPRLRHEKMQISTRVSLVDALDSEIYEAREGRIWKKKCFNKYDREIQFDIPAEVEATPELADFLGLFIAEGSFQRDKTGRATVAVWSFGLARDRALALRVVQVLQDVFGLQCDWREREDKALLEVLCHSTVLARALENWCGAGAHHKRIPTFVFGWNDANIRAFLGGLADGDGRIDAKTGAVNLKMVARDVVYGARLLLARLGMAGKATPCSHNGHDAFFLSWSPNAAYRRHGIDDKYLHLPIKEVAQKEYNGPVYNIEVEGDHSYVTDIVLHNCEAYVAPRTHKDKDSQKDSQKETRHLTLWAKNKQGYENLVKLTTRAHLDGFYYKPRVDHELLAAHSEGIICGSACLGGEVPQLIMAKKLDEAKERALKYREIFGAENYFLELMDHDLTGQSEVNDRIIDIHKQTGIPLICSNDAHYLTAKDEEMHKILVAIGTNSQIDSMALHYGPNFYLKSQDEMWDKFKHVPSAMENTLKIADMVDLQLDLKTTHFPNYDVPAGHDKTSFLKQLCKERFDKRYPVGHPRRAEATTRMEYELQVIIDKGYPGYFLVVQDFINWSKERGILVGCRGSAAGCLVSYVLGITNLDPLPYGLLFERFLNPERVSMPDIDVDFPDKRRDEVLKYVTEKYGKDKVAQIITFGTLAARAAVRDTARATGLDLKLADQVSKLIPAIPGQPITIKQAIEQVRELGDLYSNDSTVTALLDRAQKIEGMTRHASRHACGLVIGEERLDNLVPLEEKDGVVITQYHAKAVEKIGLVKMDMLGLQNNTVINDTLDLIKTRHGVDIDLENIDLTDKKVYDMMGRGDGIAIFQMEGVGMRNLLREMKPENMEHIIAQISLYRPGPMEEIPRYITGRHGGKVTYPHPSLEPILKNTYGMLLYQEQVMQAAQQLAGFTGGQADELRGAMAKKKADLMAKLKPLFVDGCVANKTTKYPVNRAAAEDIFDRMQDFAKYAFNKCAFAQTKIYLPDNTQMTLAKAFREQPKEVLAMWPDGEIRPHKVARIVKTGVKPLVKITTKNGRVIKITPEHRLLTTEGYLEAQQMSVGMELMTLPHFWRGLSDDARQKRCENMRRVNADPKRGEWAQEASERMTAYQAARPLEDKVAHMKRMHELYPDLTRAGVAAMQERAKWLHANDAEWHKRHMEASFASVRDCYDSGPGWGRCSIASNGMWCASQNERDMAEWLIAQAITFEMHKVLPNGRICDFYFAGIYWEMDGLDRVAEYFERKYGELPFVVVTPEDFKAKVKHHLQLAHAQNGDPITAIEPCGEGSTYDVEMAPNGPLNFIANGIVSHNSHAAYYGLVSYWTGYLKVNYASEFMACKMTSLLGNKEKLLVIIDDCRKHGIEVLAPDVNESNHDFTVVGMGEKAPIRFGLQAIKGIGQGPVDAIIEARQSGGKFISLRDFCERVPLRGCNKSCMETLIKSGGFESINPNRQALLDGLDGAISAAQAAQADALSGQTNMFLDATPETGRPKAVDVLPDVEDAPSEKKLLWEKEYVGIYVSDHPLNPLSDYLEANAVPLGKITEGGGFSDGARLTIGGMATKVQKRTDKNGRAWAIFNLEDLSGSLEVLAFAKSYEKCGSCITEDAKLLVTGRLSADNRGGMRPQGGEEEGGEEQIRFKMMADDIEIIDDAKAQNASADKAARPPAAAGAAPSNGNGNGSSGVKGHVLLDRMNGGANGNGNGHPGGSGHSNGNGNGAKPGGAGGSGFSFSRSSAPTVTLPPADSAPSFPTSNHSFEDEGPARIGHHFAPPSEANDAVHVHVPAGAATRDIINRLYNVCRRHPGATELWLHVDNGEEMVQLKVSASYWVNADDDFCTDVALLLGGENVLVPQL